jgi:peptide/nickel transport system permease protein
MLPLIARRVGLLIPTVFVVLTIVFLFIRLIPGDPVQAMLGEGAQAADVNEMRKQLMLDRPLLDQYGNFLWRAFHADLGSSWSLRSPVTTVILSHLPATVELALGGMLVAILIALPLGVLAARKPNSLVDRSATLLSVAGAAMPHFWLGPLMILFFSIYLGWFPVSGRGGPLHLILPAVTLGTALSAILTRMLRSSLLEELRADYVRTARAKGAGEKRILFRHALRNAFLPVLTILGLQFGGLLTGAIITETIFAWPGVGRLLIQSIFSRDYPLVQGCILVFALVYALINLLVDILYTVLDPRIQANN